MKTKYAKIVLIFSIFLVGSFALPASAGEYEALKGLESVKAVFDYRDGNVKNFPFYLDLIHQTFKDKDLAKIKPEFVVVFLGPSVKLISRNREGFSPEEAKLLDEATQKITAMSADGIKFEVCLVAAYFAGLAEDSFLPEVKGVNNGWVSVIGYQGKGYSLITII